MTTQACADDWREIAEHAAREAAGLRQNARRYEWLRERLLAADFDYEGAQVLLRCWMGLCLCKNAFTPCSRGLRDALIEHIVSSSQQSRSDLGPEASGRRN